MTVNPFNDDVYFIGSDWGGSGEGYYARMGRLWYDADVRRWNYFWTGIFGYPGTDVGRAIAWSNKGIFYAGATDSFGKGIEMFVAWIPKFPLDPYPNLGPSWTAIGNTTYDCTALPAGPCITKGK
jgi:hypothetical protein